MSTVARRTFSSTPQRDSHQTWIAIIDLLTQGKTNTARDELLAVAGIATSIIADQAPKHSPIVATCEGPRTRIYCIYDDDAIDCSDANEDPLGYDPLKGDWRLSLPCLADDLTWVQSALERHSSRVTARDLDASVPADDSMSVAKGQSLKFDKDGFLKS